MKLNYEQEAHEILNHGRKIHPVCSSFPSTVSVFNVFHASSRHLPPVPKTLSSSKFSMPTLSVWPVRLAGSRRKKNTVVTNTIRSTFSVPCKHIHFHFKRRTHSDNALACLKTLRNSCLTRSQMLIASPKIQPKDCNQVIIFLQVYLQNTSYINMHETINVNLLQLIRKLLAALQ